MKVKELKEKLNDYDDELDVMDFNGYYISKILKIKKENREEDVLVLT